MNPTSGIWDPTFGVISHTEIRDLVYIFIKYERERCNNELRPEQFLNEVTGNLNISLYLQRQYFYFGIIPHLAMLTRPLSISSAILRISTTKSRKYRTRSVGWFQLYTIKSPINPRTSSQVRSEYDLSDEYNRYYRAFHFERYYRQFQFQF